MQPEILSILTHWDRPEPDKSYSWKDIDKAAKALGLCRCDMITLAEVHKEALPHIEDRIRYLYEQNGKANYVFIARDAELMYDAMKIMAHNSEFNGSVCLFKANRMLDLRLDHLNDCDISNKIHQVLVDTGTRGSIISRIIRTGNLKNVARYLIHKDSGKSEELPGAGDYAAFEAAYKAHYTDWYESETAFLRLYGYLQTMPKFTCSYGIYRMINGKMMPYPDDCFHHYSVKSIDCTGDYSVVDPVAALKLQSLTVEYFKSKKF